MRTQHEETQNLQIISLADLSYGKEIPQRFGHLLHMAIGINIQKCIMHPIGCEWFAVGSL